MLIREVQEQDSIKLAALAKFLLGRATDTNATKTIDANTFISLAKNMGVNLTIDRLKVLAVQPPLNAIIDDIQGDSTSPKILFHGSEESRQSADAMSVDQAQKTVEKMAKRASNVK